MAEPPPFDIDDYLAQPHVARLATAGPTVTPIWYLWEDGAFWWLTGGWSRLRQRNQDNPHVAVVVDTCDLTTGHARQVTADGDATIRPYDARRTLRRYLGPDEASWDPRFNPDAADADTRVRAAAPTTAESTRSVICGGSTG